MSLATESISGGPQWATMPSGRNCGQEAAPISRHGSLPGRRMISPGRRFVVVSVATCATLEKTLLSLFVFREEDDALVGGMTVSNIHRGVQKSCTLGYWAGEIYSGNGYTTEAVRALSSFIFDELQLHRIQAACLPENERSQAVLRKCGFTQEGIARGYLRINGAWRDHVVFGLLTGDPRP